MGRTLVWKIHEIPRTPRDEGETGETGQQPPLTVAYCMVSLRGFRVLLEVCMQMKKKTLREPSCTKKEVAVTQILPQTTTILDLGLFIPDLT